MPTVVDGSIPPNKSDLLNFGLYLEEATAGDFLHLYWHRVQEPSGTTNMDFEFNKSETLVGERRHARCAPQATSHPVRPGPGRHQPAAVPRRTG